jgi:hypothetical protein
MVELKFTNFSTQVFFFGVSFFMMALFLVELKCRVPIRAEVECSNKSGGGDEVPLPVSISKLLYRKICISHLKYLLT